MPTAADYKALTEQVAAEMFADDPAARAAYIRMIDQESNHFDPSVVEGRRDSSAGARGIAQLMSPHWTAVNPLDPAAALRYGANYLKSNTAMFGGDLAKGVAAYNAGPGNVQRAVARGGANWIGALPGETQQYLQIVKPGQGGAAAVTPTPSAAPRTPVVGPITQGFGPTSEPLDGPGVFQGQTVPHMNKGLDFGVPIGTPVQSMTGGKVISTGDVGDGWGTRVWVQAPDGTIHNYGHLSAAQVKQGDAVQPGQVIAASGNTGKSTGPHLSYDVWKVGQNGQPEYLDPTTYMQGTSAPAVVAPPGTATQSQGAGAMPTTTRAPSPTQALYETAAADVQRAEARVRELQAKPKAQRTAEEAAELFQLSDPDLGLPAIRAAYIDYARQWQAEQKEAGKGQISITDLITAQQNDYTNRYNAANLAADIWQAGITNQQNVARLGYDVLNDNRTDVQKAVELAYERGKIDLAGKTALVAAQEAQQSAQVAWAMEILNRAKFVDEVNYRNAVRMLPQGTEFQPALEPNSALNQSLGRLGLNPIVIKAAQVPTGQLAPERSLATGQGTLEQSGLSLPQFDVAGVQAANERNRTLPTYQPTPITAEQVGVPTQFQNPTQIPQPPEPAFSYHEAIGRLLTDASGGTASPVTRILSPITNPTGATPGLNQAADGLRTAPESDRYTQTGGFAPDARVTTAQHGSVWRGMPGQEGGPALGAAPEPQIAQPPQAQARPQPAGVISVLDPLTGEIEDTYPDGRKVRRRPGPTPGPAPVARR